MNIKPIKSEADYDAALSAIDGLMGTAPDGLHHRLSVTISGRMRT